MIATSQYMHECVPGVVRRRRTMRCGSWVKHPQLSRHMQRSLHQSFHSIDVTSGRSTNFNISATARLWLGSGL